MPLHPAELSCLQPALLTSSAAPRTAFALFQVKLKLPLHCRCLWSCVQDVAMGSSPALLLTALWSDAAPRAGGRSLCAGRALLVPFSAAGLPVPAETLGAEHHPQHTAISISPHQFLNSGHQQNKSINPQIHAPAKLRASPIPAPFQCRSSRHPSSEPFPLTDIPYSTTFPPCRMQSQVGVWQSHTAPSPASCELSCRRNSLTASLSVPRAS